MMELIYTSSSKGVDRGSQGYCTVACSDSLPPMLKMNLETMSDYSWIYPPHHKDFSNNPVNYSFVKVKDGDEWLRVISRIGLNGLDYSGRPNKIAHHICISDDDLDECHRFSPASLVSKQNTFVTSWEDSSKFLEKDISELEPEGSASQSYWQEVTGDSGWASHLVELYHDSIDSQINVLYDSHIDPLKLIIEATELLSPEEQWDTTFSTYFNGSSLNTTCNWRFILRGSKYHDSLKSTKNLIDINEFQGKAPETDTGLDDLSIEGQSSETSVSQGSFVASGEGNKKRIKRRVRRPVSGSSKSSSQKTSVILLLVVITALAGFLVLKGQKKSDDDVAEVKEEVFYNYQVEQQPIPAGHELEEFGDVLVTIKTADFLNELKTNKKMSLDVFKTKPVKIETKLVSTKQYKVIDNVISKLFLEKVDGEFVQNKVPLIKLRISKELVVESVADIDEAFIEEFKTNIKKMKVNRVIFEFI